ncbi:MAG: hypothetical protein PHS42_04645 [Sulfurimonas sp.]|nr:hypothetical protein [Sulfurimonas sp.]
MKKLLLLLAPLLLFGDAELERAVDEIKAEISQKDFAKDLKKFEKGLKQAQKLEKYETDAYHKNNSTRFLILDGLKEVQNETQSLIASQYLINKTLNYVNIKDPVKLFSYIKDATELLYTNGLCDGYLFKGIYMEDVIHDKRAALNLYENGVKSCKIKWKKDGLISRKAKLNYYLKR